MGLISDITENEQQLWDLYYSGVVGWSLHPGYLRDNTEKMTLEECADIVDKMIEIRRLRCLG